MDSKMTIYVNDGYQGENKLEVAPSDTVSEVKRKLIENGARPDRFYKVIANGRILEEATSLESQGVKDGNRLLSIPTIKN